MSCRMFWWSARGEEFIVTTNTTVMPRLTVSHSYVKLLREKADAQTEEYIAEQLKRAEWALQCSSRRESTFTAGGGSHRGKARGFFLEQQGACAFASGGYCRAAQYP